MADGGDDPSNYQVGRNHSPLSGRIQKGEIRNPYGRKGKPKPKGPDYPDAAYTSLDKALAREVRVRPSDGSSGKMSSLDAYYANVVNKALAGKESAERLLSAWLREREKLRPTPDQIPTGVVVLSQPAASTEEWLDRARAYDESLKGKDRFAGMRGYDPDAKTFMGVPVNPQTGEFIAPPNEELRSRMNKDYEDDQ